MELEFGIDSVCFEKIVLIVISLRVVNGTSRIIIHFYQFLVRQHHAFKELNDVKPVEALPFGATIP